eukprot:Polyplicarium_translucidae@DN697_c0_g1_i1.p4
MVVAKAWKRKQIPRGKKTQVKYTIDLTMPANDDILEVGKMVSWLREHIKVDNKAGNLGETVVVGEDGTKVTVAMPDRTCSKRYLKYLTKKYLKSQKIREFFRVVAGGKTAYVVKYLSEEQ